MSSLKTRRRGSRAKVTGTPVRARPERIDETIELPLLRRCPDCGGAVEEIEVDEQFQTELPPIQPITRLVRIRVGCCGCCGRTVRPARHALQSSEAVGAAAVEIGPNALALATLLEKDYGLSGDKVAAFFARTFGLVAAASTLCRASARAATKLEPTYGALVEAARRSAGYEPVIRLRCRSAIPPAEVGLLIPSIAGRAEGPTRSAGAARALPGSGESRWGISPSRGVRNEAPAVGMKLHSPERGA